MIRIYRNAYHRKRGFPAYIIYNDEDIYTVFSETGNCIWLESEDPKNVQTATARDTGYDREDLIVNQ